MKFLRLRHETKYIESMLPRLLVFDRNKAQNRCRYTCTAEYKYSGKVLFTHTLNTLTSRQTETRVLQPVRL